MKIEIRADGAHISGYVNATEKKEPAGYDAARFGGGRNRAARLRTGHFPSREHHADAGSRSNKRLCQHQRWSLKLYEDSIGLHADVLVTDETLIELARKGRIKGCLFGMVRREGLSRHEGK